PFAGLGGSLALLFAARIRRWPAGYAVLSGVALGLAASISLKVLPLVVVVPVAAARLATPGRLVRVASSAAEPDGILRDGEPFASLIQPPKPPPGSPSGLLRTAGLVVLHAGGAVAGALPMLLWVRHNGLWDGFCKGALADNAGLFNLKLVAIGVLLLDPVIWLALLGAVVLVRSRSGEDGDRLSVIVAAALALIIGIVSPNHRPYNLQTFALPGCCLAAVAAGHLVGLSGSRLVRAATLCFVLASIAYVPLQQIATRTEPGITIGGEELQALSTLARREGTTCVAFAPAHPVFCRDATRLYLTWDLFFANLKCFSAARRALSRADWSDAVARIGSQRPTLIVNAGMFECAWERGVIDDGQISRFRQLLGSDYVLDRAIGGQGEIVGETHRGFTVHVRRDG
ncbi:MAG: hypothetical protein HY815_06765, partial [Candidatus Riflebacteria bacterium]|nr:hypothetical protein [Candidatus Riflebacteria bacterium]